MSGDLAAWRGPQHEDDESIGANDGTRWVYSPELSIWNGWEPGEDGLWEMSPAEMQRYYLEVVAHHQEQS
jgi:hypothetical protein